MKKNKIAAVVLLLNVVTFTGITAQSDVPKPADCGSTRGCFSDCQGTAACRFVVSWTISGANVTYRLTSTMLSPGTWIAVGFSNDSIMENDDVIGCASDSSGVVKFSARNPLRSRPTQYNDAEVLLTASSTANGVLSCDIQRPISASGSTRVDANTSWTLLFAKGNAAIDTSRQASLMYHSTQRYWSSRQARASEFVDLGAIQSQSRKVPKPAGCGRTQGCFSDCATSSICGFVVSWNVSGANAVYTITSSLLAETTTYVTVGFSNDTIMDTDDVIGCAANSSGSVVAFSGQNPNHRRPVPYTDTQLTVTSYSVRDGIHSCTLQRPVAASTNGRVDANTPWILLFATGTTTFNQAGQPEIGYHGGSNRYWSSVPVSVSDFNDASALQAQSDTTTSVPITTGVPKPTGCGQTIGCYSNCKGDSCGFVVTWNDQGNNATYTFSTNTEGPSGTWVAIAFSTDSKMGDDDVLGCASDASGSTFVVTAFNHPYSPPTLYNDADVRLTSGQVKDNVLSCTIERPIGGSSNGRKNVGEPWTLLFATGVASYASGMVQIQKHQSNRFVVGQQLRVEDKVDIGAVSVQADPMIKAHGSLMIVAWIFLASIGIVLARYYKPVWSNLMCSEKVWFQMHRLCMVLVFCATAIGFIIIFAHVEGYSQIQETRGFLVGHPIIGIIVMILTVINPVMAIFRPHPGTRTRPIFNWAHWFVGTAAHVLGVVNIFFGVLLTSSDVPYCLVYILGAYVAWQLFVQLILELLSFFGRKFERSEAYEMNADGSTKQSAAVESSLTIMIKRIILVIHCVIVTCFAAVLIGLLAAGNDRLSQC